MLVFILHLFIGGALSGTFVVVALVAGYATLTAILSAAIAGVVVAVPMSVVIARKLGSDG